MRIYVWIVFQKEDIASWKVEAEIMSFKNIKKAVMALIDAQRHKEEEMGKKR